MPDLQALACRTDMVAYTAPLPMNPPPAVPVAPSMYLEGAAWVAWHAARNAAREASLRGE